MFKNRDVKNPSTRNENKQASWRRIRHSYYRSRPRYHRRVDDPFLEILIQ